MASSTTSTMVCRISVQTAHVLPGRLDNIVQIQQSMSTRKGPHENSFRASASVTPGDRGNIKSDIISCFPLRPEVLAQPRLASTRCRMGPNSWVSQTDLLHRIASWPRSRLSCILTIRTYALCVFTVHNPTRRAASARPATHQIKHPAGGCYCSCRN